MKKSAFLIILLSTSLLFLFSCKKDADLTTLEMSEMIAPELISPTFSSLVMTQETEDDILKFEWTPASYGLDLSVSYILEMDFQGNDFADAVVVGSTDTTVFEISKKDFNTTMTFNGFPELKASDVEIRVSSTVNENVDDLHSASLMAAITTYAGDVPPLYILGDATPPGWDNGNALELTYIGDGDYQITIALISGAYWKLIDTLGAWAPQWGLDTGDWASGTLFFRETEDVPDPDAIPSPPSDGDYVVTVNLRTLTYTVVAAK
jgi:hypothetical protein